MVLRGDELAYVPATMGGAAQPQIHAQLLLRMLDGGATPYDATHAPRWMIAELDGAGPAKALVEQDLPEAALRSIRDAGFEVVPMPPYSEDLGHSNVIRIDPDGYTAASDPRSDGSAMVV